MSKRTAAVKEQAALFPGGDDRGPDAIAGANAASKAMKVSATKEKPKPKGSVAQPAMNRGNLTVIKNTPTNTLAVLTQALSGKDASNLQIVATLHKEMVAEQARLDFTVAMRELKRELPTINKDGKIQYEDKGKGKPKPLHFASFENIHDVTRPLLDRYGFDLWFSSEPGVAGMINVIGNLEHENGHVRRTVLPLPHDSSGGKSGSQGWASAFSFGKRIATIGLLNIQTRAPEDRDTDGNKPKMTKGGKPQVVEGDVVVEGGVATVEVCSDDELIKVRDAIAACGVSDKSFCKKFEIEKVSQLPAARLQDALDACKNFGAQK